MYLEHVDDTLRWPQGLRDNKAMTSSQVKGGIHDDKYEGVQVHLLEPWDAWYAMKRSRMACKGFLKADAYKDIPLMTDMP